ncbi:MAG: phosphate ABC transporter permease subunit PstC [Spirochaetia bacterium]
MKRLMTFIKQDSFIGPILAFCALLCTVPVVLMFVFIFAQAWPAFKEIGLINFVTNSAWEPSSSPAKFGILYMILGSVCVTSIAILLSVIVGLLSSIYIVFFARPRMAHFINQSVSLLASIPSVVYGFWAMMTLVPAIRILFGGNGSSVLAASIILSIMILPTIITLSVSALKAVPAQYLEGALALGSMPEEAIYNVVLPAAKPGLLNAFILTLGRAIGETTAVVIVAGNANIFPQILKPVRTLTANIALEMSYAAGLHYHAIIASGAVLFFIVLALNFLAKNIRGTGG